MPATPGGTQGTFESSGQTTLVSAPADGTRRSIGLLTIMHQDTKAVAFTVGRKVGDDVILMWRGRLDYGGQWETKGPIYLNDTTESIVGELLGFSGDNPPTWVAMYVDMT